MWPSVYLFDSICVLEFGVLLVKASEIERQQLKKQRFHVRSQRTATNLKPRKVIPVLTFGLASMVFPESAADLTPPQVDRHGTVAQNITTLRVP
jgi:hypothetical protein